MSVTACSLVAGLSVDASSISRVQSAGCRNSATARSYFSMPHDQKSKSTSLTASWIEAHSVQPYFDIRASSRARATSAGDRYAEVGGDQLLQPLERRDSASLQMLPSSKQGSLLPAYS